MAEFSSLDDAKKGLSQHELQTNSRYAVYKSSKNFGSASLSTARKVFWQDQPSVKIGRQEFSGIPFVVLGQKSFDCQFGKNRKELRARKQNEKTEEDPRYTTRKRKRKEFLMQETKKINCPARCTFRDIYRFPSCQIQPDCTKSQMRHIADEILKQIKAGKDIVGERVIITDFPSIEQHTCHTFEITSEPVDPLLLKQIVEFSHCGVDDIQTMRTMLNSFVRSTCSPLPHPANKRFYPSEKTVSQLMCRVKNGNQKEDQETVVDMH